MATGTSHFQYICDSYTLSLPFNRYEAINPSFECPEHNDDSLSVPLSTAVRSYFKIFKETDLHFLHLNASSLLTNLVQLKLIALKSNTAILSVSDTWLDNSVSEL